MGSQRLREGSETIASAPKRQGRRVVGRLIVSTCLALGVPACFENDNARENTTETTLGIRGGNIITGMAGVVDFTYFRGPIPRSCTGTMIAPHVILTAASCFSASIFMGVHQETRPFTIHYYDPKQGRRLVHSGPATWIAYPTFNPIPPCLGTGSCSLDDILALLGPELANSDLAVIKLPEALGNHHGGTNYHDYVRLFSDSESALSGTELSAYGAGFYSYSGSSDNNLRSYPFPVESAAPEHLVLDGDETHTMCLGDVGGPVLYNVSVDGGALPTIAGVWCKYDINPNIVIGGGETYICGAGDQPYDDSFAFRTRTTYTDWVEKVANVSCKPIEGGSRGYRRCFELPFIEDVPGEGLDANVAAAITMAALW